jgi:hypothetical protein
VRSNRTISPASAATTTPAPASACSMVLTLPPLCPRAECPAMRTSTTLVFPLFFSPATVTM